MTRNTLRVAGQYLKRLFCRIQTDEPTIRDVWFNRYPSLGRCRALRIDKHLTPVEKIVMILLLVRYRLSFLYSIKRPIRTLYNRSLCIDIYVPVRLAIVTLAIFIVPDIRWLKWAITLLISWILLGTVLNPLRIVFVDRYKSNWRPHTYNRSLIFLLINFAEIIVGFAYLYIHFDLVRFADCNNRIETGLTALYFSAVTLTTLGYGDIVPINLGGRILAAIEPLMGIILIVVIIGLFFVEIGKQKSN